MIKSHAELERYHYQALSNPLYRMEGMMDVIREEVMMNMPVPPIVERPLVIETPMNNKTLDIARKALLLTQEERMNRQQLEIDIAGLKKAYHTHTDKKKDKYKSYE